MRASIPGADALGSIERTLRRFMSPINARCVIRVALRRAGVSEDRVRQAGVSRRLADELASGVGLYVADASAARTLGRELRALAHQEETPQAMEIELREEADVVRARGSARDLAARLGFDHTDQIKIATAVSELARNIHRYAGEGWIRLRPSRHRGAPALEIEAEDQGPGIANLEEVLSDRYVSKTGLGRGLSGTKRLMDRFDVDTAPGSGTRVRAVKVLPS